MPYRMLSLYALRYYLRGFLDTTRHLGVPTAIWQLKFVRADWRFQRAGRQLVDHFADQATS